MIKKRLKKLYLTQGDKQFYSFYETSLNLVNTILEYFEIYHEVISYNIYGEFNLWNIQINYICRPDDQNRMSLFVYVADKYSNQ